MTGRLLQPHHPVLNRSHPLADDSLRTAVPCWRWPLVSVARPHNSAFIVTGTDLSNLRVEGRAGGAGVVSTAGFTSITDSDAWLNWAGPFTWSIWCTWGFTAAFQKGIDFSTDISHEFLYAGGTSTTGRIRWRNADATGTNRTITGPDVPAGGVVNVVLAYGATTDANGASGYWQGQLAGTDDSAASGLWNDNYVETYITANNTGNLLALFAWDRKLNDAEVAQHWRDGFGPMFRRPHNELKLASTWQLAQEERDHVLVMVGRQSDGP